LESNSLKKTIGVNHRQRIGIGPHMSLRYKIISRVCVMCLNLIELLPEQIQ
jgi:hypothetical protein